MADGRVKEGAVVRAGTRRNAPDIGAGSLQEHCKIQAEIRGQNLKETK